MWQDQRLLAAIAALPAEAFIMLPPEGGPSAGRPAARHPRPDIGAEPGSGATPEEIDPHLRSGSR